MIQHPVRTVVWGTTLGVWLLGYTRAEWVIAGLVAFAVSVSVVSFVTARDSQRGLERHLRELHDASGVVRSDAAEIRRLIKPR